MNKKRSVLFLLTVFSISFIYAQTDKEIMYLWTENVPGATTEKHEPVQLPQTSGNVIRVTDITNSSLIVEPEQSKNSTAVIVCLDGGFKLLARDIESTETAEWLAKINTNK